jgi:uncharacterized protein (TIGR03118 family)
LYNGAGVKQGLVVTIPPPPGSPVGTTATPTGQVNVSVSSPTVFGGAHFIFATEDGTIAAWSVGTSAVVAVNNSATAVYKGLAIVGSGLGARIYATNFSTGTVDVFDSGFGSILPGAFHDPNLPTGLDPFGIQNVGGNLVVTYAKVGPTGDDVAGPGNGFVDVYDANGVLLQRLVSNGPLNSPWGIAFNGNVPVQRRSPDRELRRWDHQFVRSRYRGVPGDPQRCCRQSDRDRRIMGPAVR